MSILGKMLVVEWNLQFPSPLLALFPDQMRCVQFKATQQNQLLQATLKNWPGLTSVL